ncbi:glutamate 5-kinase [Shouchella hunanensis]|uniref:Glutamate 5-kinase n=1 Tax=Shouchella hunanensis TaxID=766894 RepID=A0ABY7W1I0_9BACI|nr:glutamate 5-kinase [Shouchella hunanensis]WDF02797.1 glutamate 5-kinase [Shouchella hunanensis]
MQGTIVIKIGSSSLTAENGRLDVKQLENHVEAMVYLLKLNYRIVLVTSGAVAAGFSSLGFKRKPKGIAQKQAAASVGQSLLMQAYMDAFNQHDYIAAQLLLTRADFADQHRFSNISQTLGELVKRGAVPIINENDSTSVEELTFGDNDRLSALVSGIVHADMLCLFTDVNGVYDENPITNPHAKKYSFLSEVPDALLKTIDQTTSDVGTGGMYSKLAAAKTAIELGTNVFIGSGTGQDKFADVLVGKGDGTYIGSFSKTSMSMTKQYILYHSKPRGSIYVDNGAAEALLKQHKSLLSAGVVEVNGSFTVGEIVDVRRENDEIIGKGKVNFTCEELEQLKGKNSAEIAKVTTRSKKTVIHRNFWVAM